MACLRDPVMLNILDIPQMGRGTSGKKKGEQRSNIA